MAGLTSALLIGGGLLGSAAMSSSASKKAASTVQQGTDQAAKLQNDQFNKLLALQMPGYNRGEAAGGLYSQALGIPSMTGGQPPAGQQSYASQPGGGLMTGSYTGNMRVDPMQDSPQMYGAGDYTGGGGLAPAPQQVNEATGQNIQQSIAQQVMQTPGYQTQLDQGLKSIDRAAPLVGGMYSGRRMKALNDYGQQTFGGYYNDWMNRVGGVAGQAAQSANAIGQAGQQNANNVGQLLMTGANAKAQGSLNSANAWSGAIGTGLGMFGGAKGWF